MRRFFFQSFISVILICFSGQIANAWDGHFMLTYVALENMPIIGKNPTIPTETLNSFLKNDRAGLVKLLNQNEKWSEKNIPYYPTLPASLAFTGNKKRPLQTQFLEAIRVNPDLHFPLFLQYPPNDKHKIHQDPLALSDVMLPILANSGFLGISSQPLEGLHPKEKISPLEIIASASDEPDYGMDINLWETSGTWFGKIYHLGPQPFGNPALSITSQAPFHIGFYFESPLLYKLDPALRDCYPEYRIHLYIELSRFAFKTGHPYWGYRFLGWALHYVQDLTQPDHTTLAPNVSTIKLLFASALNKFGFHSMENKIIRQVSNRHIALETQQFHLLKKSLEIANPKDPLLQALKDSSLDSSYPAYTNLYPRDVVAKESHADANEIDAAVKNNDHKSFPSKLAKLFRPIGAHSRNLVRYAMGLKHQL